MLVLTRSLAKSYGQVQALVDCDLDVPAGEVCGLLGPNGSGKTTLLRVLLGFLRPTAGQATIAGLDCTRQTLAVHRQVSYLPGEPRLFRNMRGYQVLRFFSRLRPEADLVRAEAIAARLGLDLSRSVARASTGMRQMLALCVALSIDAPLWILDEPTANLDPSVRHEILALVREAKQDGRTVLFSSHVLPEVEETCDRVVILRRGRLVHSQPLATLKRQHRISAALAGPLPPVPAEFLESVTLVEERPGEVVIHAPGELAPLLGWLSTLPLASVRIEPLGLRSVYDSFHGPHAS